MINVVCGVIYQGEKFFIARRKTGIALEGKWEFPGGKIDNDESEECALNRELNEELGMQVKVNNKLGEVIHDYSDITIKLIAYKCDFIAATFALTDHDEYKWVCKQELINYDLADADKPFIDMI